MLPGGDDPYVLIPADAPRAAAAAVHGLGNPFAVPRSGCGGGGRTGGCVPGSAPGSRRRSSSARGSGGAPSHATWPSGYRPGPRRRRLRRDPRSAPSQPETGPEDADSRRGGPRLREGGLEPPHGEPGACRGGRDGTDRGRRSPHVPGAEGARLRPLGRTSSCWPLRRHQQRPAAMGRRCGCRAMPPARSRPSTGSSRGRSPTAPTGSVSCPGSRPARPTTPPPSCTRRSHRSMKHGAKQPNPFGSWHGDWMPWNLLRSGTDLWVWDWERSASGVPVGLDAAHFRFDIESKIRGRRRRRRPPRRRDGPRWWGLILARDPVPGAPSPWRISWRCACGSVRDGRRAWRPRTSPTFGRCVR